MRINKVLFVGNVLHDSHVYNLVDGVEKSLVGKSNGRCVVVGFEHLCI